MRDRLASALQLNTTVITARKRDSLITRRLMALGLANICGRCGGSGTYLYNPMDGTVCYGCNGSGGKTPRVTKKLIAQAEKEVEAGKLEPYFEEVRLVQFLNSATDLVFKARRDTGIFEAYDWRVAHVDSQAGKETDATRLSRICSLMGKECDRVREVVKVAKWKRHQGEKVDLQEVKTVTEQAIARIQELAKEM